MWSFVNSFCKAAQQWFLLITTVYSFIYLVCLSVWIWELAVQEILWCDDVSVDCSRSLPCSTSWNNSLWDTKIFVPEAETSLKIIKEKNSELVSISACLCVFSVLAALRTHTHTHYINALDQTFRGKADKNVFLTVKILFHLLIINIVHLHTKIISLIETHVAIIYYMKI